MSPTDPQDHDALHRIVADAVADVEPHDRFDQIRASVRSDRKVVTMARTRSPWLYVATGVVATAAVIGVVAYATGSLTGTDDAGGPGPAHQGPGHSGSLSPAPSTPSTSPGGSSDPTSVPPAAGPPFAVYYVGDNPVGKPVLFREFHAGVAVDGSAAAQQSLDELSARPLDPDYSSVWTAGAFAGASLNGDVIDVALSDGSVHDRPSGMSAALAEASVQQVIYTVQAAYQKRLPVQFTLHANPVDRVLGVPTSEPLAQGKVLTTLSLVNISTPNEGDKVSGTLTVTGVNNAFEGTSVIYLQSHGTKFVTTPVIGGMGGDKLWPWTAHLDLAKVPPGRYTLVARNDDPSGRGRAELDTRTVYVK